MQVTSLSGRNDGMMPLKYSFIGLLSMIVYCLLFEVKNFHCFASLAFIVFTFKKSPKDFHGCNQSVKTRMFFTANNKQYTVFHFYQFIQKDKVCTKVLYQSWLAS